MTITASQDTPNPSPTESIRCPLSRDRAAEQLVDPIVDNVRIERFQALIYPQLLLEEIPITLRSKNTVCTTREEVSNIIHGMAIQMSTGQISN